MTAFYGGPRGGKTKTVIRDVTCHCGHEHTHPVEVFDDDAYWQLDWLGNLDTHGGFFYFKPAYPVLAEAQRHRRLEREAAASLRSRRSVEKVVARQRERQARQ